MVATRPRARRVEAIFETLIDEPPSERRRLSAHLCDGDATLRAEVLSLLDAADRAGRFLSDALPDLGSAGAPALDPASVLGRRLGPYRLVRELGSGGMGVVFLAERIDGHYRQRVAIKLLKHEPRTAAAIERFHVERQILADLQHPNVARLLDGGTDPDGRPYLVMEHVRGEPIDAYCRRRDLSPERVLALFRTVCEAVRDAHRNLTVHCDLKPANILIAADGTPKLLDFGVARLLHPARSSAAGAAPWERLPLTPEFAAPEQLDGGTVTTATDVYALGVVLYRLLVGKAPYALHESSPSALAEELAAVTLHAPSEAAPPARRARLRGDLDRIVSKAMSPDPSRRYRSAGSLAEDIERFLDTRPVAASVPTRRYLFGRFVARHRWRVAFGVVALVSLVGGSVLSTWQWRLARERQVDAEQRFEEVRELTATIVSELPATIASLPGSTRLRERLFDRGVSYLERLALTRRDDLELARELATAFDDLARLQGNPAYSNLGDTTSAVANFRRSLALREELVAARPDDPVLRAELASSHAAIGTLEASVFGKLGRAHELTGRCLTLLGPPRPSPPVETLTQRLICHTLAAHWRNAAGEHERAARHLRAATHARSTLVPNHPFHASITAHRLRARVHEEWAEVASGGGDVERALHHERRRLELVRTHRSGKASVDDRREGAAWHAYAARLVASGRLSEGRDAYGRAIAVWQRHRQRYPADASAVQALAVIHAERAEALGKSGASEVEICAAYARSVAMIRRLPEGRAEFPRRYTWSPATALVLERHGTLCTGRGSVAGRASAIDGAIDR